MHRFPPTLLLATLLAACVDGSKDLDGTTNDSDVVHVAVCGDGTVHPDEVCDDNNTDDGDYCSSDCLTVSGSCGDGLTQTNEVCDDNNTDDGDYCDSDCLMVTGSCGDGLTQTNEVCDDNNTGDGDYCASDCLMVTGACGDGNVQSIELCDDGNTDDGDYCASDCLTVTGSCGDGLTQTNEVCDDNNTDDGDYCASDCLMVTGACGDGNVQSIELCDDGNTDDGDYCDSDCLMVTGSCGDGLTQTNEVCDDNNTDDGDYCSSDCATVSGFCGDDTLNTNEECDTTQFGLRSCTSEGFFGGSLGCDPTSCRIDTSTCNECGNGVVDAGEVCDGLDLMGATCSTLGDFDGGEAGCLADCSDHVTDACCLLTREVLDNRMPIDVIVPIDNSGSMGDQIVALQGALNDHLAVNLASAGVDFRLIVLANHGYLISESVCIEEPLSGIPAGGCASPPIAPVFNPPIFFQYSQEIASHDALCRILDRFDVPDRFGSPSATEGWGAWLREDSLKIFLLLTDDGVNCSVNGATYNDADRVVDSELVAQTFDAALQALSPTHFTRDGERNYIWYSTVGTPASSAADGIWTPDMAVTADWCPSAADPGTGYQALSNLTNGLRFSSCDTAGYPDWLAAVAADAAVKGTTCEYPLPTTIPHDQLQLVYTAGDGSTETWDEVVNEAACDGAGWFFDDPSSPTRVHLCPASCSLATGLDAVVEAAYCPQ